MTRVQRVRSKAIAKLRLVLLGLLMFAPQGALAAAEPDVTEARSVVTELQDTLLEAMKLAANEEKSVRFKARYEKLKPVVKQTHHLSYLAQLILRTHWSALTREQKLDFLAVFQELSVTNYASKFDDYNGEVFEVVESKASGDSTVFVRTKLTKADGDKVSLDYVLRRFKDEWGIINIVADGVSEVATKRTEYGEVIKSDGFEGLLTRIREQTAELRPTSTNQSDGA